MTAPEAPRWRLTSPHYLNVFQLPDGTRCEWEHRETARETGRTVRKLFRVPILLNPNDPADFTHPGKIIVTQYVEGTRGQEGDIIFEGEPTPEMEPLNDEAEAITAKCKVRWFNPPIDSIPIKGGMNMDEQRFYDSMVRAFEKVAGNPVVPNQTVPQAEYDALKERLAKLEATIVAQNKAPSTPPHVDRRV